MKSKKTLIAAIIALFAVAFSGCIIRSADELYALPMQAEGYLNLTTAVRSVISDTQYSSPVSGANQQPVQMADLDGDGQDEALVFTNTGGVRPLKIYIFDLIDDNFENVAVIEGNGNAFERIEYAQLDGNAGVEIVVGRQVSNQVLQSISAYNFSEGQPVEILHANYSEFTISDLDRNGNDDLFLLRFDSETGLGYGELYRYLDGMVEREPELAMSSSITSVRHLNYGYLSQEHPAVFVGGLTDDGATVTDVFTFHNNIFSVYSTDAIMHFSSPPVRGYSVFATDIDSDGIVELPNVVKLPGAVMNGETEDAYHLIHWMNFDPSGGCSLKLSTFHYYSSGWFLQIPDKLGKQFIVSRGGEVSGARGLVFSQNTGNDTAGNMLFTLYAFSGSSRNNLATQEGRFILGNKGEITFSAELGDGAALIGLTQEELVSMFNFIRVNWDSGET